ncbi:MAG: inverse autotransporter beta domain-containing protein [Planctomycetaceae bacterium]|nr:inverse autotransporter beta domain-containing protein [Planctomycetaceae bacterium]
MVSLRNGLGGLRVLWTTALIAAALAQAPAPYESAPVDSSAAAAANSGFVPQWMSIPEQSSSRWGFENFLPRVGVQHRSEGYGYDSGYTSFDLFVPLYQEDFFRLTAMQGSLLVDNFGDFGAVAGLVQRQYVESWDRVVGVNAFYNHRSQGGNDFNQFGFGVETLGNYVDWRANAYIPVGDEFEIPNSGGGVTEAFFSGRSILVNFIADKPLTGFDTEVGGLLPGSLDIFRAYAGLYHFTGDYSEDVTGVQGRLEARLRNAGVASLAITNDGTFGTNVVLGIGFWLPGLNPRNQSPYNRASTRMGEDVVRNQNIVIDRSPTTDPVPARWLSGTQIDVVHIDSNAGGINLGTPVLPVQTLLDAQTLGSPESLLFAHANSTFAGEGIVLQDGQQFLGEGIEHQIHSLYGSFVLPTVTPAEDIVSVPAITGAPGDAVTVANGATVSGFSITGSGGNGVVGNNVSNVTLDRLNINGSTLNGIQLLNAGGGVQVTENFINSNGALGVQISTSAVEQNNTLVISDNTILGNQDEGIDLTTNGQSVNTLVMERNLVRVVLGPLETRAAPLIDITTLNSSRLTARVEDNDVEDSFLRDDTSPDEDPYYQQLTLTAAENSRVDVGFVNNRFVSDRDFLLDNPRNGSFGFDLNSTDLSVLRARLDTNSSSLNYAFSENFISTFQLEDTLSTNTGTPYYFPTENFIETISAGTLELP